MLEPDVLHVLRRGRLGAEVVLREREIERVRERRVRARGAIREKHLDLVAIRLERGAVHAWRGEGEIDQLHQRLEILGRSAAPRAPAESAPMYSLSDHLLAGERLLQRRRAEAADARPHPPPAVANARIEISPSR